MENTNFANPHGLPKKENFSCALDIALLSNYAVNIYSIRQIVNTKEYTSNYFLYNFEVNEVERKRTWKNTNKMLKKGFNGIKTGITESAGSCLSASIGIG